MIGIAQRICQSHSPMKILAKQSKKNKQIRSIKIGRIQEWIWNCHRKKQAGIPKQHHIVFKSCYFFFEYPDWIFGVNCKSAKTFWMADSNYNVHEFQFVFLPVFVCFLGFFCFAKIKNEFFLFRWVFAFECSCVGEII